MPRIAHFEVYAGNPNRAMSFYSGLLGWKFNRWDGPVDYWIITTGPAEEPGINGGLVLRQGRTPGEDEPTLGFVCTASIANLDATLSRVPTLGGRVTQPKVAIPGVGWLAYIRDTEGNLLGLMQNDPSAS